MRETRMSGLASGGWKRGGSSVRPIRSRASRRLYPIFGILGARSSEKPNTRAHRCTPCNAENPCQIGEIWGLGGQAALEMGLMKGGAPCGSPSRGVGSAFLER
jgi:hypothetical protein